MTSFHHHGLNIGPGVRLEMTGPGRSRALAAMLWRRTTPLSLRTLVESRLRMLRRGPRSSLATPSDVRASYRLLLGRKPDRRGLLDFLSLVGHGMERDELVRHFLSSPEFRDRNLADGLGPMGQPIGIEIEGLTLYVDPNDFAISSRIRTSGAYEPQVLATLRRHLPAGGTFVDVGASFGFFATCLGRHVGPDGRVIAFEPGPQNRSLLLFNLAMNGIDADDVRQVALGHEKGLLLYSRSGANGMVSPFQKRAEDLSSHDLVQASTLDAELNGTHVDAMKIDAEGAEGSILMGALNVLSQTKPVIVFEFSPPALDGSPTIGAARTLGLLRDLGYQLGVIDSADEDPPPLSPEKIRRRFEASPEGHLNLLAWIP
ncbi:MAG: FkbM family methyltransferase [Acidimicrobiales bacterium]